MTGAKGAFEALSGEVLHSEQFRHHVRQQEQIVVASLQDEIEDIMRQMDKAKGDKEEPQHPPTESPLQQVAEQDQQQLGPEPESEQQEPTTVSEEVKSDSSSEKDDPQSLSDDDRVGDASTDRDSAGGEVNEQVEFLASVCTEEGFQDFINISRQEMQMKDSFIITEEKLDSYFMSQATIRVEEDGE